MAGIGMEWIKYIKSPVYYPYFHNLRCIRVDIVGYLEKTNDERKKATKQPD